MGNGKWGIEWSRNRLRRSGWFGSVVVGRRLVIERSRVRLLAGALPGSLGQLSLPSLRVGKSSTGLLAGVRRGTRSLVSGGR